MTNLLSHTGVYLFLKGTVYANNSIINITEIGETDTSISPPQNSNNGLQCITDRRPCCRFVGGRVGEWFFPSGIMVPSGTGPTFYRSRGRDDGTVSLNRANTNVMMPTGLFCCVVPDATDVMQRICARVCELVISSYGLTFIIIISFFSSYCQYLCPDHW